MYLLNENHFLLRKKKSAINISNFFEKDRNISAILEDLTRQIPYLFKTINYSFPFFGINHMEYRDNSRSKILKKKFHFLIFFVKYHSEKSGNLRDFFFMPILAN